MAASLRDCATPSTAFLERVAFGAALRGGCAAHHLPLHLSFRFLQFPSNENLQQVPLMLPTLSSLSPIPIWSMGASLRDRATLPSPQAVSALRAGIPRASVRFADCALRLPGGSLRSPPPAWPTPSCHAPAHGSTAPAIGARVASLALPGCAGIGLRLGSPAFAFANAALRPPRRAPAAHAPRRLPSGSDSGTGSPDVRYPGSGPSYALRRLGSHTPRTASAKSEAPPGAHRPRDSLCLTVC